MPPGARAFVRHRGERGRRRVTEDALTLAGPRKKDPVLSVRRVFVHSTARAQAAASAPAMTWTGSRAGLGSRHYPTMSGTTRRIGPCGC